MDFTPLKNYMKQLTDWRMPGNAIVIYEKGHVIFRYQSGWADLEQRKEMTPEVPINIYSSTKIATVTAGLQLLEQGQFLLSDPLYAYLPEYRNMQVKTADGGLVPAKNAITMWDLFTMTGGLSYDCTVPALEKARTLTNGQMDTVTVARCLAQEPLSFEPGTHWQYSLCHDVLAAVIELISGTRFSQYVREHLFLPLGIQNAWFHRSTEVEAQMAAQYKWVTEPAGQDTAIQQNGLGADLGGKLEQISKDCQFVFGPQYDSGGAGIVTTPSEYVLLMDALANGGLGHNGNRILSAPAVELLRTNQLNQAQLQDYCWPQLAGYGYGLGVCTLMDRTKAGTLCPVGEFGWGGAAGASALADPERGISVFYAHHMLNSQEAFFQPRLRNVLSACLDS